jgi:AhpD family alkylhydroperoxidase
MFVDHTLESAPEGSKEALRRTQKGFGFVPVAMRRLAESPALLAAFDDGTRHFAASSLTPVQQEVVILTVARRNECHLCVAIHGRILERRGHRALVAPLTAGEPTGDPALDALVRFVEQLMACRGQVSDAELQAFFDAGFQQRHALDVVVGVAAYTLSTFANRLIRAPVDPQLQP